MHREQPPDPQIPLLEALTNHSKSSDLEDICKEFDVSEAEFREKWGELLKKYSPTTLLMYINAVKEQMHLKVNRIAKNLAVKQGIVREIIDKLGLKSREKGKNRRSKLYFRREK